MGTQEPEKQHANSNWPQAIENLGCGFMLFILILVFLLMPVLREWLNKQ